MEKDLQRMRMRRLRRFILIVIVISVVLAPIFIYFRITSDARIALREAKNVKLTLEMLEIEYYGKGKTVYDQTKNNGLSDGVIENVTEILGQCGEVNLQSYSKKKQKIYRLFYKTKNYQVQYTYDKKSGDCWEVDLLLPVFNTQKDEG